MILASILSFGTALLGTGVFDKNKNTDLAQQIQAQEQQIELLQAANSKLRITVFALLGISLLMAVLYFLREKNK
jgi:cell division protein FtsB